VRGTGSGRRARLATALAVGLVVSATPASRAQDTPAAASAGAPRSRGVAETAPDVVRNDLAGHPIEFRSFRGRLVLVSFWATWCEPCRAEAPRFSSWQKKYGPRGLQVLGISMDDDAAAAARFARKLHLSYPIVMGDAALAEAFGGVLGLPLAFLVDPSGQIVARYRGEPDLDRIEAQIGALLPVRR
jgi:cytochrome c biogenesis protein CcmG, thiol:disulfide interchange protein DsbE